VSPTAITSWPMPRTWIPPIATRGWVIVTRDIAIQRRPLERKAWEVSGAILLMVRGPKLTGDAIVRILLERHANGRLDMFISKRRPPMVLHLQPTGALRVAEGGGRRGGHRA
jgi:hypothetical protein